MAKTIERKERARKGRERAASWLRDLMLTKQLTIKAIVAKCGVSRSAVSGIVNGHAGSFQTLQKIAEAFEVNVPTEIA